MHCRWHDEEKAGKEKDGEDKNRKAQGTEWSSVKNESVRKKTAGRAGKKTDAVQRYRDLLKFAVIKQDERTSYVLLGIENQTDVHYAMPVRNAIYDACNMADRWRIYHDTGRTK